MAKFTGQGKEPYVLTAEDQRIFDLARAYEAEVTADGKTRVVRSGSFLTSYYLRQPGQRTGVRLDDNIDPPWQLKVHHATQSDICIIGGFGSGKTVGLAFSKLIWATITPNYKFLNVAPTAWQSRQMYDTILQWVSGTLWEERFLYKAVEKPFPKIFVRWAWPLVDEAGKPRLGKDGKPVAAACMSTLEFMSSGDDANRIKTWEGDDINIDQAEQQENLSETVVSLGTRLRGTAPDPTNPTGRRNRRGVLSMLANAEQSPELWDFFSLADEYPETNLSVQISTYGNKNLTEKQIADFKRRIKDPTLFAQHLDGKRPDSGGVEFTKPMLEACTDESLDRVMEDQVRLNNPAFRLEKMREAGVVLWQMPKDPTRKYVVVGDGGQGRPPYRNAPVVMVFDTTDYPKGKLALRAFWWGDGGGTYGPFVNRFMSWMDEYDVVHGAFDATGGQRVHLEMSFGNRDDVIPVDMGGTSMFKRQMITTLKLLLTKGKFAFPKGISGIGWQLLKYTLPDDKLSQDIVAALLVMCGYLQFVGIEPDDEATGLVPESEMDSFGRSRDSRGDRERSRRVVR